MDVTFEYYYKLTNMEYQNLVIVLNHSNKNYLKIQSCLDAGITTWSMAGWLSPNLNFPLVLHSDSRF